VAEVVVADVMAAANDVGAAGAQTITAVSTTVVSRPYLTPFEISSGSTPTLESVLVRITAQDAVGIGETTAMTAYSGETTAGLIDAIQSILAPAVVGRPLFDLAGLHQHMDAAVRGRSLAKAAIDMAAIDAQGRALGVPAGVLLGGRVRETVDMAWVIGLAEIEPAVAEAVGKVAEGYRHIKVKGGHDPRRDIELVTELCRSLPAEAELAIDFNEAYDLGTALPMLQRMQRAGLVLAEQPVPGWDVAGLARLTQALDLRVMADESIQSVHDAMRLVRRGACDVFNIKLLKVGGFYRARQVAAIAEAAGIAVKVGTMPELGIATMAAAHFAAATPVATVPADLVGPLLVDGDIVDSAPFTSRPGHAVLPDGPGLGVELVASVAEVTG
jgi:L-alanine-DL-glutamate epimerase-like enolase superfamily enzyme